LSRVIAQGLVADLGGTNARFARGEIDASGEVRVSDIIRLKARDYPTADGAIDAFLAQAELGDLDFVSIACAGPVRKGEVALTNLGWSLSKAKLQPRLKARSTHLINDLAAVAWAAPTLEQGDLRPLRDGAAIGGEVIAVLGVGTGTNCAAFIDRDGEDQVVVGEGGHISFAPNDDIEAKIWEHLNNRFDHVSIERLVSGPGLFNIYQALCDINGQPQVHANSEAVSAAADAGDALGEQTLDCFCRVLGAVSGDFVLTFGASALYIAGGIAPQLMCTPARAAAFQERFEHKGRFRSYLEGVGAFVITHPNAALLGAVRAAAASLKSN
jgi:glucokinase